MLSTKIKCAAAWLLTLGTIGLGLDIWAYPQLTAAPVAKPTIEPPARVEKPNLPEPAPTRERRFTSNLSLVVWQFLENGGRGPLGFTGPGVKRVVVVPANAVWAVQPMGFGGFGAFGGGLGNFGGGLGNFGGGAFGLAGGAANLGGNIGFNGGGVNLGGGGALGNVGGNPMGKRVAPRRPQQPKNEIVFGQKLSGKELKALLAEINKQAIPGLMVDRLEFTTADIAELKGASGLQTVFLTRIPVNNDSARELAGLKNLRLLGLEATGITEVGLEKIKEAPMLQTLYLAGEKITNKSVVALRDMDNLQTLRLTHTAVGHEGLAALKGLKRLETLDILGPSFTDKDLPAVKDLSHLKTLRLHQTAVTDAGLEQLREARTLTTLAIDCHYDREPPWSFMADVNGKVPFPEAQQLVTLDEKLVPFEASPITNAGLNHLVTLRGLTDLTVISAKISDDGMKHLAELKDLKRLTISGEDIGDAGIAHLKDLKKLERLDLHATRMTIASLSVFTELPALKVLYTNLVPFDPAYNQKLAKFKAALPHARVYTPADQMKGYGFGFGGVGAFGGFGTPAPKPRR